MSEGDDVSTPAGWYDDAEVPGGQRYWDGEQWTQQRRTASGHREDKKSSGAKKAAWVVGGVVGVLVLMGVIGQFLPKASPNPSGGSSPTATQTSHAPSPSPTHTAAPAAWKAKVPLVLMMNPASVRFAAQVTNTGGTAAVPQCFVNVQDASGAYTGYDTFTLKKPVAPGKTVNFTGTLVVTNQGAKFVTQKSIKCTNA